MKTQINENHGQELSDIIKALLAEKNITIEDLSNLTNIPKKYLDSLISGDIKNMPAAPYVRGYLNKISQSLEINPSILYDAYTKIELKSSGKNDHLPKNKFAIKKGKKGWIIVVLVFLSIGTVIYINKDKILGVPNLEINIPETPENGEPFRTFDSKLIIKGKVASKDSITIDKEDIAKSTDGSFEKEVILKPGLNTFMIKIKRFLGGESSFVREVYYEAPFKEINMQEIIDTEKAANEEAEKAENPEATTDATTTTSSNTENTDVPVENTDTTTE